MMKDAVGSSLREAWKRMGNATCNHPELSLERSFAGVITGSYICTTCGALMNARSMTAIAKSDPSDEGESHETPR